MNMRNEAPGGELFHDENLDLQVSHEAEKHDECGIVGVWAPGKPVASIAITALQGLQHRGESSAGVFVRDPDFGMVGSKGLGRVTDALADVLPQNGKPSLLDSLGSPVAIGHNRYSTSPEDTLDAAQPFKGEHSGIAVAHNGHIEGLEEVAQLYNVDVWSAVSDSHRLTLILDAMTVETGSVEKALQLVLPHVNGAYCLSIADGESLTVARDPWAFRPLAIGALEGDSGFVAASEMVVFQQLGANKIRDVEPGEIVTLGADGISSSFIDRQEPRRTCMFEFIYNARPDGEIDGVPVHLARKNMGRFLAEDHPVEADIVIGMPESGVAAAFGYSEVSGIPVSNGVVKNQYSGRSFILRADKRDEMLKDKARIIPTEVAGQRIVLVDDSVIKGNTMKTFIKRLRDAGAAEVHLRLAAPRYEYPCFMGMDTGDPSELIASYMSNREICDKLKASSIGFNTPQRVEQAAAGAAETAKETKWQLGSLCTACATGEYPISVPVEQSGSVSMGMPTFRTRAA